MPQQPPISEIDGSRAQSGVVAAQRERVVRVRRMRSAERSLRDGDTSVAAIAHAVGSSSETAFSRAFQRTVGIAPKHYRTASRHPHPTDD